MPKSGQTWNANFLAENPLFRVWEPFARPFRTRAWPDADLYSRVIAASSTELDPTLTPLRFREMEKKSRREKRKTIELEGLYDGSIALRGEIPCLPESYHDLLNAIVFCAFPRAKRALHARQFRAQKRWLEGAGALDPELEAPRLPGTRSREQDALTILDEGGTVLLFTESAHAKWSSSTERLPLGAFAPGQVLPLLFGHALLEHLVLGQKALRSSGVLFVLPDRDAPLAATEADARALFDFADRALAARLTDETQFQEPGADSIFELHSGEALIGPPKPAWHLPNPKIPALPLDRRP